MSRWFAAHAGLQLEGGYFYLCPACYQEKIEGEFEAITERIRAYQKPDRASREAALDADAAAQAAAGQGAGAGAPAQAAPASADQAAPPRLELEAASAPS
ncbi:MAG TPA: hypothetical protein VF832_12385, partial [Longimicrobiales bacterium]